MGSRIRLLFKSFLIVFIFYLIVFISQQVYLADSRHLIFEYTNYGKPSAREEHSSDNRTLNEYTSLKTELIHLNKVHMPVADRKLFEYDVLLGKYLKDETPLCDGSFRGFGNIFAVLKNVSIDPSRGRGKIGGEIIADVINQSEKDEYYRLSKGYFNLPCPYSKSSVTSYKFSNKDHLQNWMQAVNFHTSLPLPSRRIEEPTFCVQRYAYAHVYFTMLDIYNAFLVCNMFNLDPLSVTILWIDGHPKRSVKLALILLQQKTVKLAAIFLQQKTVKLAATVKNGKVGSNFSAAKNGQVSSNFAAAKNGKVGSNFMAEKNGQVSTKFLLAEKNGQVSTKFSASKKFSASTEISASTNFLPAKKILLAQKFLLAQNFLPA